MVRDGKRKEEIKETVRKWRREEERERSRGGGRVTVIYDKTLPH